MLETAIHYLLYSPNFSNESATLFEKLRNTDESILIKNDSDISKVLPFDKLSHSFHDVIHNEYIHNGINSIMYGL